MPRDSFPNDKNCEKYWETMSALADGECSPEEERELRAHIAKCSECAQAFAFLERSSRAMAEIPPVASPTGLRSAILASTTRRPAAVQTLRAAFARARVGLSVVAAAAVIGYVAIRSLPSAETTADVGDRTLPAPAVSAEHEGETGAGLPEAVRVAQAGPTVPLARRAIADSGSRELSAEPRASALEHRAPDFVGSNNLLASLPFDPAETFVNYKPVARTGLHATDGVDGRLVDDLVVDAVVINVGGERAASSPESRAAEMPSGEPGKAGNLLDKGKDRFKMAFGKGNLLEGFEQPEFHDDDSGGLTLIKGKF
jgi:anti-sigma factor RsiW